MIAERAPADLGRPQRAHLDRLTGPLGIFQHARGRVPALEHGYCTDDVARALMVDVSHYARTRDPLIAEAIERDIRFLEAASSTRSGHFRNLRSPDGRWLDTDGTEDSQGRAIQGLAFLLRCISDGPWSARADALLSWGLPSVLEFRHPRPMAYATLGALWMPPTALASRYADGVLEYAAMWLERRTDSSTDGWPWPEDIVTYDTGALAQALIECGRQLRRQRMLDLGIRTLEWLFRAQTRDDHLRPIGNRGWWPRRGVPARFDQQPIEAASLLQAGAAAFHATGDPIWRQRGDMAFRWFLGDNDVGLPVADVTDGSCGDGITETGLNSNRGAESTLCWLSSVETMLGLAAGGVDDSRVAQAVVP